MPRWTEEQSLAIHEKGKNIIVSAGAGSGKTAVLSERVLTHVKNGMHIDDMLILTFTNAAAAEMKERIRKKLSEVEELKEELDKVDIAYITTFDAYALSLVKQYNHLLNISDKVTIIDSSIIDIKKSELLEEIFENHYKNKDEKFLKLISDFCLKDDREIFNAVLNINKNLDNKYDKTPYLNSYIENFYNENYIEEKLKEYINIIKQKLSTIKTLIENLDRYVDDSKYIEKLYDVLSPILNAQSYEEFKNNAKIKLPPVPKGSVEEAKTIKAEIPKVLKEIEKLTKYEDENQIKESLYKTQEYVEVIINLINELDEQVNEFKLENNAYEFIDISKMAIKILEQNESVRLELKNKYKEILIDEYQDTNDLQDIFISKIENNNVYMVGDIKQSIYRFRNANPLLFKNKYDNYSVNNGGFKIDLNKNFRSRCDVTENINLIFNLIMNNEIGGADYVISHQMVFGNTAYNAVNNENYQMDVLNYQLPETKIFSREEIEIFTIAKDIKDKINSGYKIMDKETMEERPITFNDFVILMDRSTNFETYKKIFEYLNIPLTIYRDQDVSDSVDIMLIKNIYNLIVSIYEKNYDTMFKYSYLSVARSYLFSIEDNQILSDFNTNQIYRTEIFEKCKRIADNLDTLTNEEIYEQIIESFNFYQNIIKTGNVNAHLVTLESIGKIVKNVSSFGYTPKQFLKYLNDISEKGLSIKLSLNKDSGSSVKIMTIHTSKGLEYHVCYFSGLYKKFNIDELKNKFMFENKYGIITPYFDKGVKNTIIKTLVKQKYIHEEISEKLRLFYVALTRAREKMVLVTHLEENILAYKDGEVIDDETRLKYMNFEDMLNSVYPYLEKYMTEVNLEEIGLTKDYNLKKRIEQTKNEETSKIKVTEYQNNSEEIETKRFSKDIHNLYTKEEKQNIELGLDMHKLLEQIDFKNPDYSTIELFKQNKIKKFIDSGILDGSIEVYKEYEFIYEKNNTEMHGFIDLLVEYKDHYKIIDYKLKEITDEAYKKQLHGYQEYIESITGKTVETYLYSIIDEKIVQI